MNVIKNCSLTVFVIMGACALVLAVTPPEESNHPAVFPHTADPTPLGDTNQASRTSTNTSLPPMYRGGISNLHDRIGTNAANHGYNDPTLTNRPNPNLQMP
jgi:hypothetical protein